MNTLGSEVDRIPLFADLDRLSEGCELLDEIALVAVEPDDLFATNVTAIGPITGHEARDVGIVPVFAILVHNDRESALD